MSQAKRLALVTGANGFIGANLCRALLDHGCRVRAFVLAGTPVETLDGMDLEIVEGDITQPETLKPAMQGVDTVYHLAALATDWAPMEAFLKVIHQGTTNVLVAASEANVKRVLHTSSLAIHAYSGHDGSDETAEMDSEINGYAISKQRAEEIVNIFHKSGKQESVIVRPGVMPYGPGDTTSFVPMAKAIRQGAFGYINGGKSRITTSYVGNLAEGMILACEHPNAAGETFILGDDEAVTWRQIGEDLADALGVGRPKISTPYWVIWLPTVIMETLWKLFRIRTAPPLTRYRISVPRRDLVFTSDKAKKLIGYNPKVGWDEGHKKMVEWYKEGRGKSG